MTTTTYYNLNIVEGTDIVNPLTVDNPNYQKIDETMHDNAVAGVTLATELTNATIHAITRENSDCSVIRFIATSRWKAGDSVTVDGVPVLALLPSGETLPDGAYVINANVLCVLTGTNLTVYASKNAANASEIPFNDTTVGAELVRLDGEAVRLDGEVTRLDGEVARLDGEVDNLTSNLSELNNRKMYSDSVTTTGSNYDKYINMPSDCNQVLEVLFSIGNSGYAPTGWYYDKTNNRVVFQLMTIYNGAFIVASGNTTISFTIVYS